MPAILLKSRFFYGGIGAIFALATLHGPLAKAQEPGPELRALLQAQQARMDEQAKVLAEQNQVIQNQGKVLEEQANLIKRLSPGGETEKTSTNDISPRPLEAKPLPGFSPPRSGLDLTAPSELIADTLALPKKPVKDDGMMAVWGNDGRLTFKSADGSTTSRLGGMFQLDGGWYLVSTETNKLLNKPLEQGSDLRRLRLRSDGIAYDYLEWVVEFDLSRSADYKDIAASNNPEPNVMMNNIFFGVRDIPFFGTWRVGHIKEELSFYSASSGRNFPFMERPAVWDAIEDPYVFSNGFTVSNTYFDDLLYTWIGFFQTNTRTGAFAVNPNGSYAFDVRACIMPIYEDDGKKWLNIGATGSFRANPDLLTGDNRPTVMGSNVQPQIRTGSSIQVPALINPGAITTNDGTQLFTVCYNQGYGPWTIGAQYDGQQIANATTTRTDNKLEMLAPAGNLYFQGASFEVLRFLTMGDHRGINKRDPSYLQVTPQRNFSWGKGSADPGIGAWEVGFRYDFIQIQYDNLLENPNAPANGSDDYATWQKNGMLPGQQRGGNLSAFTLGMNWYLNPNATVMTNYVFTSGCFNSSPNPGTTGSYNSENASFHSFGTRFQLTF